MEFCGQELHDSAVTKAEARNHATNALATQVMVDQRAKQLVAVYRPPLYEKFPKSYGPLQHGQGRW